jgi:ActR/RegA family two-component response regulator
MRSGCERAEDEGPRICVRVDTRPRLDEAGGLQSLSQGLKPTKRGVMRTRHSLSSLNIPAIGRVRGPSPGCRGGPASGPKQVILLISDDAVVAENLRRAAEQTCRSVVRADGLGEALRTSHMVQPVAVVLDLDLRSHGAWEIADCLLQEAGCPPLILLTGRRDQFDVSTAIRAGTLVDESTGLAKVLEAVDQALAPPDANRGERNAIQLIMIQWLRPCAWSVPVTPSYRFWGLNE